MQEVYFLARHTPFWAVPLLILSTEFAYLFWLRKKKATVVFCLVIAFIAGSATLFYVYAGGPEKTVKMIKKMHREQAL